MARLLAAAILVQLALAPALAQVEPVGPCSPYRAEDGDIPSELPGCAGRRRPVPGSLADELDHRRAARQAAPHEVVSSPDGDDAPRPRRRRTRPRGNSRSDD